MLIPFYPLVIKCVIHRMHVTKREITSSIEADKTYNNKKNLSCVNNRGVIFCEHKPEKQLVRRCT